MSLIDQVVDNFQAATQRRDSKKQLEANLSEVTEEFKHQKDALELQKQILKDQLVQANQRLLLLEEENLRLKATSESAGAPPELSEVSLAPQSHLSADEVSQLQNQLETLLPEYESITEKHSQLQAVHLQLQNTHESVLCDLKDTKAKCDAFETTVKSLLEKEALLSRDLDESRTICTNLQKKLDSGNETARDNETAYKEATQDLQAKIDQLSSQNRTLQENAIKNQIDFERTKTERATFEAQYLKLKEDTRKQSKDSKSIRKVCAALQMRLRQSEENQKKISSDLEEERDAATELGLQVRDLERSLRQLEMEHEEMKKDCQNWEKLYLEAKASSEKVKLSSVDERKMREREVFDLLNRIVTIKDTLDNMKIEIVRHQTPGLKDLERLELCQRNIQLLVPEIRKTQQTPSKIANDALYSEIAKVTTSLVMQLANHQQLINRFLARALGAKPVKRGSGRARGR